MQDGDLTVKLFLVLCCGTGLAAVLRIAYWFGDKLIPDKIAISIIKGEDNDHMEKEIKNKDE